ncbi:MAG: hypothetical protein KDA77_09030 [Planctomycetaceae bacterium]|nr:hypothetical protein [Planctomycetaceae bacterium]
MKTSHDFAPCVFLPYSHKEDLPTGTVVYDVSSYGDPPFCTFSPLWPHGDIPIPGMPGKVSETVEGIWQGLKIIRGKTAPHLFKGRGKKRVQKKPAGHQYGNKLIGYLEARYKIYKVAYEWVLANRIDPALLESLIDRAFDGVTQYFHDLGDNGDINNLNEAWAHAAPLVWHAPLNLIHLL